VISQIDFNANPEGDDSIASRIRNTFEITPTATALLLVLVVSYLR
jgi:hypothetical protein